MKAGSIDQLRPFIEPKSLAIIGVSRKTGAGSFNILENLQGLGYRGRMYPVNPNASELLGVRAYRSVSALPEPADIAIVATPRDIAIQSVRDCIEQGIRNIIVVAQGFADSDDTGKGLQRELVSMARAAGARIVGPNTLGTANGSLNYSSSFGHTDLSQAPVGLVCQTGVFLVGFPGVRLVGKAFDLGNACDVSHAEAVEYLAADPGSRVLMVHLEGSGNPKGFIEAVRAASQKKPVLVWKTAATEAGARMSESHTGSLTGSDRVWDTAIKGSGAIRVHSLDNMSDLVNAFSALPPMKGRNVAMATFTGGFAIMAIDACSRHNLRLARLTPETLAPMGRNSPAWLHLGNPVDIWNALAGAGGHAAMVERLREALRAILRQPGVDALVFIGGTFDDDLGRRLAESVSETAREFPDKPVAAFFYGASAARARDLVAAAGQGVVFPSVERAVYALGRMADYEDWRNGAGPGGHPRTL